jgi:hypothetical protein
MKTRISAIPDSLVGLAPLWLLLAGALIIAAMLFVGQARANLHAEARAAGCFASTVDAPARTDKDE